MSERSCSPLNSQIRFFRAATAVALALAFITAVVLLVLRFIHLLRPDWLSWNLKSAVPLILIGLAFAFFQFSSSRTRIQVVLGLSVSAAFILWGLEQFVSNKSLASSMDDFVVFLFVLDLSLVIYGHLKPEPRANMEPPRVPPR